MNNFNFYVPLTKVEKTSDGGCIISGYASTAALDLDGEVVKLDAIKKALPAYWQWRNIREMHTTSAVGVGQKADMDEKGLFLTSKIVDKEAVRKCLEGVYKGYSIGGKKRAMEGNQITEIDLVEISVVDRPANPECSFEVKKSAKKGAEAYLITLPKPVVFFDPTETAVTRALAKGVEALAKRKNSGKAKKGGQVTAGEEMKCAAHGMMNCGKCAKAAVKKRKFSAKEREKDSRSGAAMPGGGFPIENKDDLSNARQAVGRAKNPFAARAHIKSRADALGVKLPEKWSKKLAKGLILEAETALASAQKDFLTVDFTKYHSGALPQLAAPPSPTQAASDGGATVGFFDLGHGIDGEGGLEKAGLFSKREQKLLKRMGIAGQLSYCFDSIREAQRSLLREAETEGGDKKDKGLANELGTIAQKLAGVISQKATHEGAEALDLSDAGDKQFLNMMGEDFSMNAKVKKGGKSDLEKVVALLEKAGKTPTRAMRMMMARKDVKKARGAMDETEKAIKEAGAMVKAAYLAKKAKPKGDSDMDDQAMMEKLNKAFSSLQMAKTYAKAVGGQLKKAQGRSGETDREPSAGVSGVYEVPAGVKDLTPAMIDGPGVFEHGSMTPFPGKAAKLLAKLGVALPKGSYSKAEVDAMLKAATAEAKLAAFEAMPAGPVHGKSRPIAFDASKAAGGEDQKSIMHGVDPARLADADGNRGEIAKMIGNQILGGHGKSVFDPSFKGSAGAKAA